MDHVRIKNETAEPVPVNIVAGSSAGTEYIEGDIDATIAGGAILWEDTSDTLRAVSAAKPLPVNIVAGSSSGVQYTEADIDATITGTALMWEDAADTLRAVSAAKPLPIGDAGGSLTVDGTVAVTNADMAASATSLGIIDDWDETDRAKVNPIVGQAGVQGGSGTSTALTQRVVLATDVALPAGTNAIGKLAANSGVDIGDVDITSIAAGNNNIGDVDIVTVPAPLSTTGNGTAAAALRVTVSSDSTGQIALAAGSATVGNVGIIPNTSGGATTYHLVSAATTNATNIKASAGQVFGWYIYNSNAAARKLAFHNTAGSPSAGASIYFSLVIPATSGANVFTDVGIPFSTGIAITTVTEIADSGTTAVAAEDLVINIWYK